MSEEIFRKKSLNNIKSPEDLNDYVRVANPGVWLIIVAIVVLLAGACIWGVFGKIESTVPTHLIVENGKVVCCVTDKKIERIEPGMVVETSKEDGVVASVDGNNVNVEISLPDGTYDAKIITESISPLSFVFN